MLTNKFLIMNTCKKCDTEGLVSKCCDTAIHFMANGAPKCSKCKRFTKLVPCSGCKEDNQEGVKVQVTPADIHIKDNQTPIGQMIIMAAILLGIIAIIIGYKTGS